ncbi:hypothetical protein [Kutzneria sp. NPDC051319]|uniref:hypothetical protein n=1 Tax=Kutzneria sp. NPDC051319 TaxID=3155047 RepID=UPI003431B4AA
MASRPGVIRRSPTGDFIDLEQPLADQPLEYQGARVPRRANELGLAGQPRAGTIWRPDPPEEVAALEAARTEEAARWARRSTPPD